MQSDLWKYLQPLKLDICWFLNWPGACREGRERAKAKDRQAAGAKSKGTY